MHSVDLSNYQPQMQISDRLQALLATLTPVPWHIIIRLSHESTALRAIAINQLLAVEDLDLGPGGYGWSYGPLNPNNDVGQQDDPRDAVKAFLDVLGKAGAVSIPILWFDAEGSFNLPTIGWMDAAFDEAVAQGQRPGIYSNPSWLAAHFGATMAFAGQPLWTASYDGTPDLASPSYQWGGMKLVGHQWTSSPVDRSVFLPEAVA